MKRIVASVIAVALLVTSPLVCLGQEAISRQSSQDSSEQSLQQSSEDSLQNSTDESSRQTTEESSQQSTEQSSQNSTDNSFQYSTEQTSGASSQGSTQASADGSSQLEGASAVTLLVGGAVVVVGLTAVGITWLVDVTNAKKHQVVAFQDQIYAADGPEYQQVVDTLGIEDKDLVHANDELVADGFVIETDQDAADYLVALMLRLTGKMHPAG